MLRIVLLVDLRSRERDALRSASRDVLKKRVHEPVHSNEVEVMNSEKRYIVGNVVVSSCLLDVINDALLSSGVEYRDPVFVLDSVVEKMVLVRVCCAQGVENVVHDIGIRQREILTVGFSKKYFHEFP